MNDSGAVIFLPRGIITKRSTTPPSNRKAPPTASPRIINWPEPCAFFFLFLPGRRSSSSSSRGGPRRFLRGRGSSSSGSSSTSGSRRFPARGGGDSSGSSSGSGTRRFFARGGGSSSSRDGTTNASSHLGQRTRFFGSSDSRTLSFAPQLGQSTVTRSLMEVFL